MTSVTETQQGTGFLKTGSEYRKSLQDGRVVWHRGERVEDVTNHPATAGGIDWIAALYDSQFDPATQDIMTYTREDGSRVPRTWQVPRTSEDLQKRREFVEFTSRQTLGFFGRQLDNIAMTAIGFAAYQHLLEEGDPTHSGNILSYIKYAEENNIIIAGLIADPQGARAKEAWSMGGRSTKSEKHGVTDRLPPLLRVMDRSSEGITISGSKIVGTMLPQAHEMLVLTQPFVEAEESFVCAVPANAEGVHIVLRQSFARPAEASEHPLASRGEEMDCLIIFENVFVPTERVFSVGVPSLAGEYGVIGAGEHWNTLCRLATKAELFVGLTQLMIDALSTTKVPKVRELVADVIEYAQTLRAFALTAEQLARPTESGVMWPDVGMITAGRIYGVEHYGPVVGAIRELAGQGPLMLFSDADFDGPELGPLLTQVMDGFNLSAAEKNRLMGLVWDITSDGYGMRMDMFERLNGYPLFFLKERQYSEFDRLSAAAHLAGFLDLPDSSIEGSRELGRRARESYMVAPAVGPKKAKAAQQPVQ